MLTLEQIKNATFERSGMKGYKADSVDDFIDEVIATVEKLEAEKADLEQKLELLADKLEDYRKDEDSLRAALLGAQKLGASVIAEARQKADIIMRDATIKSESMLSKSEDKIHFYQDELARMKAEVSSFKGALLSLYRNHIEVISQIPAEEPAEEEPAQEAEPQAETASEQPVAPEPTAAPAEEEGFSVKAGEINPELFDTGFDLNFVMGERGVSEK